MHEFLRNPLSIVIGTSQERKAISSLSDFLLDDLLNARQRQAKRRALGARNGLIARRVALAAIAGVALPLVMINPFSRPEGSGPIVVTKNSIPTPMVPTANLPLDSISPFIDPHKYDTLIQKYISNYEALATLDPQAQSDYESFTRRRIPAFVIGSSLAVEPDVLIEPGYSLAVVGIDKEEHRAAIDLDQATFFAAYGSIGSMPVIYLRNENVNPVWAGFVMAHEVRHSEQELSDGPKDNRNYYQIAADEQDAYRLQFRVMNRYSDGRLNAMIDTYLANQPQLQRVDDIDQETSDRFSGLFGEAFSPLERASRHVATVYAINFRIAELSGDDPEVIQDKQIRYYLSTRTDYLPD